MALVLSVYVLTHHTHPDCVLKWMTRAVELGAHAFLVQVSHRRRREGKFSLGSIDNKENCSVITGGNLRVLELRPSTDETRGVLFVNIQCRSFYFCAVF